MAVHSQSNSTNKIKVMLLVCKQTFLVFDMCEGKVFTHVRIV